MVQRLFLDGVQGGGAEKSGVGEVRLPAGVCPDPAEARPAVGDEAAVGAEVAAQTAVSGLYVPGRHPHAASCFPPRGPRRPETAEPCFFSGSTGSPS